MDAEGRRHGGAAGLSRFGCQQQHAPHYQQQQCHCQHSNTGGGERASAGAPDVPTSNASKLAQQRNTLRRNLTRTSMGMGHKVPSMLFEIEMEGSEPGTEAEPRQPVLDGVAIEKLYTCLQASSEWECKLREDVEAAVQQCRFVDDPPEDNQQLALTLREMGYQDVRVRTALGGGEGHSCLRNLRHMFLTAQFAGRTYVIDPTFKEQFIIAKPTERYAVLLECLPQTHVAEECAIEPLVRFLCTEMAEAFQQQASVLPPWRCADSMLSKWLPRRSMDKPPHEIGTTRQRRGSAPTSQSVPLPHPPLSLSQQQALLQQLLVGSGCAGRPEQPEHSAPLPTPIAAATAAAAAAAPPPLSLSQQQALLQQLLAGSGCAGQPEKPELSVPLPTPIAAATAAAAPPPLSLSQQQALLQQQLAGNTDLCEPRAHTPLSGSSTPTPLAAPVPAAPAPAAAVAPVPAGAQRVCDAPDNSDSSASVLPPSSPLLAAAAAPAAVAASVPAPLIAVPDTAALASPATASAAEPAAAAAPEQQQAQHMHAHAHDSLAVGVLEAMRAHAHSGSCSGTELCMQQQQQPQQQQAAACARVREAAPGPMQAALLAGAAPTQMQRQQQQQQQAHVRVREAAPGPMQAALLADAAPTQMQPPPPPQQQQQHVAAITEKRGLAMPAHQQHPQQQHTPRVLHSPPQHALLSTLEARAPAHAPPTPPCRNEATQRVLQQQQPQAQQQQQPQRLHVLGVHESAPIRCEPKMVVVGGDFSSV